MQAAAVQRVFARRRQEFERQPAACSHPCLRVPDLGPRRRPQHGLDINTLCTELKVKTLGEEEDKGFGCAIDGPAEFRREPGLPN